MQTTTSENNKVLPTPTIPRAPGPRFQKIVLSVFPPDPGSRIRKIVLSVSIPLVCIGILLLCLACTEMSVGYWGETHLTRDGVRFVGIGSFLLAIGSSILLPGLSYAAWKTSHAAVENVRGLLSKPGQLPPSAMNLETLAGSTSGWAKWWLFFMVINVIGIVLGLAGILFGDQEDAILLPSAGYTLPLTASAYVYSVMLGWILHVMMSSQAKDADSVRYSYRARFQPSIDVDELISELVSIPDKGYMIGRTQVTQAQWMAVMGGNPSNIKGADNPVEKVSWNDCQAFLKKLNDLPAVKASSLVFRLPTDVEWEYACRAGATGKFCKLADGTEITAMTLDKVAWYADNSDNKTHPVGLKQPNSFGLYDMHGNVWEWTLTTAGGGDRVYRGGGWLNSARNCETSFLNRSSPDSRSNDIGFRLCAEKR